MARFIVLGLLISAVVWAAPAGEPVTFVMAWGESGTLPGMFRAASGLATDSQGLVHVCDRLNHRIQVFDGGGGFLRQWGGYGGTPGRFREPTGIALSPAGSIYVVEGGTDGRVQVFTPDGSVLNQWTGTEGAGPFAGPLGIAVDAGGDVYIADTGNHRIQKFTGTGEFITAWGSRGTGPGQFDQPAGIAVDRTGNLYIADRLNSRIQKFTASGAFIASWSTEPATEPCALALNKNDGLVVICRGTAEVIELDSGGAPRARWNSHGAPPDPERLYRPNGIALDASGNLFISEQYYQWTSRVQKFRFGATSTAPARWGALKARYR